MHRSKLLPARLALLVAISGVLLTPFGATGRNDAARRVRVGGTRGVGVIHQVRVEPYGRAAVEHAYLDDDDESYVEPLARRGLETPPRPQSPAFLPPAAEMLFSEAQSLASPLPADQSVRSTDRLGVPPGRAPPRS